MLTRYLFVRRGKRLSYDYLFAHALEEACQVAPDSHPTITTIVFGTPWEPNWPNEEHGYGTIMAILEHSTANMSMIYAHISDKEVLHDYQAVLGPGASIAGPYTESLREGRLSQQEPDWFQTKFVTTPEYAPRLRQRRTRERELIEDAQSRGWQRKVERHQCTVRRIEQLLSNLGEPLEGEEAIG
ncbi:MAG: hypothetical protein ACREBW_03500 [Candidatus Micrarchaeaceae archaeon]